MSKHEHKKIKNLRNFKRFELLNRLACYACIIPFFYATSCLGQEKEMPVAAKVGGIGFIASTAGIFAIKSKKEKAEIELEKIRAERKKLSY